MAVAEIVIYTPGKTGRRHRHRHLSTLPAKKDGRSRLPTSQVWVYAIITQLAGTPPLAPCGHKTILVGALNNVARY